MFGRKSKLIRLLTQEIQRLRELLARTEGERDSFKEMAREAIGLAKEKHFPPSCTDFRNEHSFPQKHPLIERAELVDLDQIPEYIITHRPPSDYAADYVPPPIKHCPECGVSVRSDIWPMECPACHCVFGFEE